jgi:thiamine kinase-like enzyme
MLSERELVDYLLERELISARSIAVGDLTIVNVSRRNRNFKVLSKDGPCYMIKQGEDGGTGPGTLYHEAFAYRFLSTASTVCSQGFLPILCDFDEPRNVLVLELTTRAHNLRHFQVRRKKFGLVIARRIGHALAALHSLPLTHSGGRFDSWYQPWAFTLALPDHSIFRDISSANLDLIRTIQSYPIFRKRLVEVQDRWEPRALLHGDFKWDNCVAFATPGSEWTTRVRIVDWEFAGIGDPCWDVGSVLTDYLMTWLMSIPVTGESTPERWVELAGFPLESMRPSIAAFWNAYRERTAWKGDAARGFILKSTELCAVRLLQTLYEHLHQSAAIGGSIYCALQLVLNLLERPEEGAAQLLGLTA